MPATLPATMRALRVHKFSEDYSGCALDEVPLPIPRDGEVLVRIHAAAIGFQDLLLARGGYQARPPTPFGFGIDVAGEIVAYGASVADFAIGDAVIGSSETGAFAEYAIFAAIELLRKPAQLSYAQASALNVAYLTTYAGLVGGANIQPGEWLLVHGAAGGVGLAAIDLGKALGARIIATSASDEKLAWIAKTYAPEAVININGGFREKVKQITGGGANVIYDPVGGDVFDESLRCIAFGGRLLVVGFASGRIPEVKANIALLKGCSVVGVNLGGMAQVQPVAYQAVREKLWKIAADGRIHPHVHAEIPLTRWADAFATMDQRQVIGRIVLIP